MWTTVIRKIVISILAAALLWGAACPPVILCSQQKEITYGINETTFQRQKLSIFKSQSQINASDLRPEVTIKDSQFVYRYNFTRNTPIEDIPIQFYYRDGRGTHFIGQGWQISYTLKFKTKIHYSILSPIIPVYKNKSGWFLLAENEEIPLQQHTQPSILKTKKNNQGYSYQFKILDCGDEHMVLPYRIIHDQQEDISFVYQFVHQKPQLQKITRPPFSLIFKYNQHRLHTIQLHKQSGEIFKQWQMAYHSPKNERNPYLSTISHNKKDVEPQQLRFTYALPHPSALLLESNIKSSVWKLQQGNIRYMLPNSHMSIRTIPGLRFMDINKDHHLDILDTTFRRIRTWIGNPDTPNYWQEFNHSYKPPVPLVKYADSKRLTGNVYSGLSKEFITYQYNTHSFQSIISSSYSPSVDGKFLEYKGLVYFPRIKNSRLDPDTSGYCWRPDDHTLLRLPVPLQYEGKPWPSDRPGIESIERTGGTGAQFVNFSNDGKINLFYIGKRFRDAQTGQVLLTRKNESWFRDTKNCKEWYETAWNHMGKTRKVKVDLCQAFWKAREKFWDERYPKKHPGKSFWRRMDLNKNGTPNGKYVLPWQEDAHKYFHFNQFRNVRFARLNRYFPNHVFAIIHGRGCATCQPAIPAIKEIYLLAPGILKWRKLKPDSDYYPPATFFDRYDGIFADITGDGIDDAIIAAGKYRKTYINTGQYGKMWQDSPAYYLPRACDLSNGNCQLLDLNGDNVVDLFTLNGSKIYLNGTHIVDTQSRHGYMSTFTDQQGQQKQVKLIDTNKNLLNGHVLREGEKYDPTITRKTRKR
jgi:hypothetical protein